MAQFFERLLERMTKMTLIATIFYTVLSFIFDEIPSYINRMAAFLSGQLAILPDFNPNFTLSDWNGTLGLMNHFFPLDELWQMVVDSIPYIITIITVRWIKSFIPGMGN